MLRMSERGKAWLAALEGLRLKAYQDNKGIWTIGIGMTYWPDTKKPIEEGDVISSTIVANAMFCEVLAKYEEAVEKALYKDGKCIRNGGPPPAHVTDALISFCYNIGINAFNSSTALKRFNGNFSMTSVAQAMGWYRKPNLTTRRQAEAACLLMDKYVDQAGRPTPEKLTI